MFYSDMNVIADPSAVLEENIEVIESFCSEEDEEVKDEWEYTDRRHL